MGAIELRTTLLPRGNAAAIVLDEAQVAELGEGKKRFPVRATVERHTWRTVVTRMRGEYLLGLSRAVREAAGVEIGQEVAVALALDNEPRVVEVPAALTAALEADADAGTRFEGLAYTHKKEFARWIAEAKREETRQRRVAQALAMLRAGQTRS